MNTTFRKEELANAAPPLPSLVEDDDDADYMVEFGQTKLHDLAAIEGADLLGALKGGASIAARNYQFKTARDIALEKNLTDNVKQIGNSTYSLKICSIFFCLID